MSYFLNKIIFTLLKIIFISVLLILQTSTAVSQSIPKELFNYKSKILLYDAGEYWETLTTFGPVRYQQFTKYNEFKTDSLTLDNQSGFIFKNNDIALYNFTKFNFKKNFYGYFYPIIVTDVDFTSGYSGIPINNYNKGFISYEMDISGIGFQNNWVIIQLGRGRESWGAGNDIQLALSNNSNPYDYFMLASDYGKIRVKYVHGFLESVSENINRYILGKGIEWTNKESLIFSLSEIIIYSGKNRPLDIGYLNPLSSHLEVELNNRLNINTGMYANAIWQLSIDWRATKNLRLSANLLFDEFVIDDIEKQNGKEHGKAYSTRLAYTPNIYKRAIITSFIDYTNVGTPTFRHGTGTNNFVQRGSPLGWNEGSDGHKLRFGINYFNRKNLIISTSSSVLKTGSENITERVYESYKDYLEGTFPSGNLYEAFSLDAKLQWWRKPNIAYSTYIQFYIEDNNPLRFDYLLSLNYYFLKNNNI